MKEQFKQAIAEELEEPNAYENRKVLADVDKAAAECERICEERMGAFAEWMIHNDVTPWGTYMWILRSGMRYTTAKLIKIFNDENS